MADGKLIFPGKPGEDRIGGCFRAYITSRRIRGDRMRRVMVAFLLLLLGLGLMATSVLVNAQNGPKPVPPPGPDVPLTPLPVPFSPTVPTPDEKAASCRQELIDRYEGTMKELAKARGKVLTDEQLETEIESAMRLLKESNDLLARKEREAGARNGMKQAVEKLQEVIRSYPGTEGAAAAEAALGSISRFPPEKAKSPPLPPGKQDSKKQ